MKRQKVDLNHIFSSSSQVMGIIFGLLVFVVISSGVFSTPRIGMMDSGKYERILAETGLAYKESDLESKSSLTYMKVIEKYEYVNFSYARLFSPNQYTSMIYLVSVIRLITEPFGLGFSTIYLYFLYAILAAYAVYSIVRSVSYLAGNIACIPGVIFLFVLSDQNLTAFFGSLYETGALIIGFLLTTAMCLRAFTYGKEKGFYTVFPLMCSAILLLNATSSAIAFIPFVIAAVIIIVIREWNNFRNTAVGAGIIGVMLFCSIISSISYFHIDPDMTSDASAYHAAFQGFLENSKFPAQDLSFFGLDDSYEKDIGKSYYQEDKDYVHNPRDEAEAEKLFRNLNQKTILNWYIRHPVRLMETVFSQTEQFNTFETGRTLGAGQLNSQDKKTTRSWSGAETVFKILLPQKAYMIVILPILISLAALLLGIKNLWRKRKGISNLAVPVIIIIWAFEVFFYLPLHIICMGKDSLDFARVFTVFQILTGLVGVLTVVSIGIAKLSDWYRTLYEEAVEADRGKLLDKNMPDEEPESFVVHRWFLRRNKEMIRLLNVIAGNSRYTLITIALLSFIMVGTVLFVSPRASCVNNGDYGRMMQQLGLNWTEELNLNTEAQALHEGIETYSYNGKFDFASLTLSKPTYSLVFPAALARGISFLLNQPFSTFLMSVIMSVFLLLCILSIVKDMYPFLGKFTIFLGVGMCIVFLSESYIVWFNSLFGEGCIFLGVMLVTACSIHLAVLPRGKGIVYIPMLIFFSLFLLTSKAQMLIALPVVSILVLVFVWYHRPKKWMFLIPYMMLLLSLLLGMGYDSIKVYQNNADVSERQTIWQSVFYGALMISNDPINDMRELGINVSMAEDIGKHAYLPDSEYVISPNSKEADQAFYDHVNTFTMVKYYLKRPVQFNQMLNYAAEQSQEVYNEFRVYAGQDYSQKHDTIDRWGLWLYWRSIFAFSAFWKYGIVYGILLIICILKIVKNSCNIKKKFLIAIYMSIMFIGALQYPLSVIGNGFADNHKQMFGFMLCHDLLVIFTMIILLKYAYENKSRIKWDILSSYMKKHLKICKRRKVKIE
jgi:hypothetical protein